MASIEDCRKKGCIFSVAGVCYWDIDPNLLDSESGCNSAAVEGNMAHIQGGDIRYGVMKTVGFKENSDPINAPKDHPINQ